jgi:4-amino-4-deoxy-L-arabinose transferase-like glycosyltransferase
MNKTLITLASLFALSTIVLFFPAGAPAVILASILTLLVVYLINHNISDLKTRSFLVYVFMGALLIRGLLATVIFGFNLQHSFGPDALYYDQLGNELSSYWWGESSGAFSIDYTSSGWSMPYIVGAIYFITGTNALAAQLVICVLGAATSVIVFLCAKRIFHNNRVAKYSALFVAFFPGMIVWTSQLLKDGIIIFLLILALLAALNLQQRLNFLWLFILAFTLFGLSSLRFYIFFMVLAAIIGGFVLGLKTSGQSLINRFIVLAFIGIAFSSSGVWDTSEKQVDKYVNLERLQLSRTFASKEANSGLGEDVDVTTTSGLLTALPLGLLTLFLAPFPWQVQSITQIMTMPEMFLWWSSLPFTIKGLIYAVKTRFRETAAILFFIFMLSLSYAVYQGNLGTLYRQRAQIQVCLLIFTAVGFTLSIEKRENSRLSKLRLHSRNSSHKLSLIK